MTKPSAPLYLPAATLLALPNVRVPIAGSAPVTAEYGRFLHDLTAMLNAINSQMSTAATVTIPLAKVTPAGVNGSLVFERGLLVAGVVPT